MAFKNKNKKKDYLTLSFTIFFSFILFCLSAVFFLFNVVKLKDLNLNNTVFAATDINIEMLGFSDMTISEFMKVFSGISSPDEFNILKGSPTKTDKTEIFADLSDSGISEDNIGELLSGEFDGVSENIIVTQKMLCVIENELAGIYGAGEIKNIQDLCGGFVEIKNITIYENGDDIFLEAAVCADIENIRNKILYNFGYPVFQICGKIYFNCTYRISVNSGIFSGETVCATIYDTNKENTDKLIKAIFTSYYMSDTQGKYVIDENALCEDVLNILTLSLNNMGKSELIRYNGDSKDIKQNEIVLIISAE